MDVFIFIIFLSLILSIFFAWFFYNKSNHEQKTLIIEQGGDFSGTQFFPKQNSFKYVWLKLGILVVGISIGLVIIALISNLDGHLNGTIYPGIIGLCGGGAMVFSHYLVKKDKLKS